MAPKLYNKLPTQLRQSDNYNDFEHVVGRGCGKRVIVHCGICLGGLCTAVFCNKLIDRNVYYLNI